MRKLMVLAAMLAMTMLVAAPALAQSSFDFDDSDNFDRGDFFDLFDDNNNDFDNNGFSDNNGLDNSFDIEQETGETGDVDLNSEIVNTGNNSNQCAAPLQFGNTGNLQNAQGFLQTGSTSNNDNNDNNLFDNNLFDNNDGGNFVDDVDFEGASMTFEPEQNVECNQQVQQSAAASG
jgi:hypothetical protein